jgi:anti-sigma regulatory factor (Ser/Thr protein kinase)
MTPNPEGSTFSMTNEDEHLLRLRKWLREQLAGHGVPKQDQPNLLLAVGELCANSIQHAYEGRGGQPITVSVRSWDNSVVIEVEDFGKKFDADG